MRQNQLKTANGIVEFYFLSQEAVGIPLLLQKHSCTITLENEISSETLKKNNTNNTPEVRTANNRDILKDHILPVLGRRKTFGENIKDINLILGVLTYIIPFNIIPTLIALIFGPTTSKQQVVEQLWIFYLATFPLTTSIALTGLLCVFVFDNTLSISFWETIFSIVLIFALTALVSGALNLFAFPPDTVTELTKDGYGLIIPKFLGLYLNHYGFATFWAAILTGIFLSWVVGLKLIPKNQK